jgi:AmmeMemoRadiSam system protein A
MSKRLSFVLAILVIVSCVGLCDVYGQRRSTGRPNLEKAMKTRDGEGSDKKVGVNLGLAEEDKHALLSIARSAIEAGCTETFSAPVGTESARLKEPRGAFVSLHKKGQLRGCVGYIRPHKPLDEAVEEMARAAAFEDTRFSPVTAAELNELHIEISVLTPLRKIATVDEVEVGRDGIYVSKGLYSGLLLPQVATEYGWDRETFLQNTCTKAGLEKDAWKDKDTEVYVFSADIFGETGSP